MKRSTIIGLIVIVMIAKPALVAGYELLYTYHDINGNEVPFSRHSGRLLLVEGFATTCRWCLEQHEALTQLWETRGTEIAMLTLSLSPTDTLEELEFYNVDFPTPWALGIDTTGSFKRQFGITSTPTHVILSSNGATLTLLLGLQSYDDLLLVVDHYLSLSNPEESPELPDGLTGGNDNQQSLLGDLFNSPIFQMITGATIMSMVYIKMTGGVNNRLKPKKESASEKKKRLVQERINSAMDNQPKIIATKTSTKKQVKKSSKKRTAKKSI